MAMLYEMNSAPRTPKLTAQELAEVLRLNVTLVRKMARSGKIPAIRIRNGARSYFRFDQAKVEDALENEYSSRVVSEAPKMPPLANERVK